MLKKPITQEQAKSSRLAKSKTTVKEQLSWLSFKSQVLNNYSLNLSPSVIPPDISSVQFLSDIYKNLELLNLLKDKIEDKELSNSELLKALHCLILENLHG